MNPETAAKHEKLENLKRVTRRHFFEEAFGVAGLGAGSAFGAVGADTAAFLSVSRTATRVWTGTVCPSCTLISTSFPAAGAGISASTLSVEISKSGSSRLTSSPSFLSHLLSVPSAMDSPIWGMRTSMRAMTAPEGRQLSVFGRRLLTTDNREPRTLVCRQPSRRLHHVLRLR